MRSNSWVALSHPGLFLSRGWYRKTKSAFLDFPLTIGCDTFWRILLHFFTVCNGTSEVFVMIEDMFVDGQNRDVWCNSKKPINDSSMYKDATLTTDPSFASDPSVYALYFYPQTQFMYLYLAPGNGILPSAPIAFNFFLCEWYGVSLWWNNAKENATHGIRVHLIICFCSFLLV
jgi:hypothetical protein